MISWLRKKAEEAVAQINPFDGGKTAQTVRQARQAAPAVTVRQQAPQPPQQAPSYGKGLTGVVNRARDVVDANTAQDRYKRVIQNRPEIDKTYQDDIRNKLTEVKNAAINAPLSPNNLINNKNGIVDQFRQNNKILGDTSIGKKITSGTLGFRDNFDANTVYDRQRRLAEGKGEWQKPIQTAIAETTKPMVEPFVKATQQVGNMVVEGNRIAYSDLPKAIAARASGNKQAMNNVVSGIDKRLGGQGMFGGGMPNEFKTVDQGSKGFIEDPNKAKSMLATGTEIGTTVAPVGPAATLSVNAFKQPIKQTLKTGTKALLANGVMSGGESAARQYMQNGKIDAKQVATDTALGATISTALPFTAGVVVKGGSKLTRGAANQVPKIVNKAGQSIDDVFNGVKEAYNNVPNRQAGGIPNPFNKSSGAAAQEKLVKINKLSPSQMPFNRDAIIGGIKGDTRQRMSKTAEKVLNKNRGQDIVTSDGMPVVLSGKGNSKYTHTKQGIPNELFEKKMRITPKIKEALGKSKQVSFDDRVVKGIAPDGFAYQQVPVKSSKSLDYHTFDVGKNKALGRNTLYYSNVRKTPDLPEANNGLSGIKPSVSPTIPNKQPNVKPWYKKQDGFVANPFNKGDDIAKSAPIEKTPNPTVTAIEEAGRLKFGNAADIKKAQVAKQVDDIMGAKEAKQQSKVLTADQPNAQTMFDNNELLKDNAQADLFSAKPKNVDDGVQEVIDATTESIKRGDLDEARMLAESLPEQQGKNLIKQIDIEQANIEKQILSGVQNDLDTSAKLNTGDSSDAVMKTVADKLAKHLNAPKALYKITGFKRTYKTPQGNITVGGKADEALDNLIFGTDMEGFTKNMKVMGEKFGGTFKEISDHIKATSPDDANYDIFKENLYGQLKQRPSYSRRASGAIQDSGNARVQPGAKSQRNQANIVNNQKRTQGIETNPTIQSIEEAGAKIRPAVKQVDEPFDAPLTKTANQPPQPPKPPAGVDDQKAIGSGTQKKSKFANETVPESDFVSQPIKDATKENAPLYTPKSEREGVTNSVKRLKAEGDEKFGYKVSESLNKKEGTISRQEAIDAQVYAAKLEEAGDEINISKASEVYDKLSAHYTKAGQLIQAAAMMSKRSPAGMKDYANKQFAKAGVKVTPQIQQQVDDAITKLAKTAPETDANAKAMDEVLHTIAKNIPQSKADLFVNAWRANLLTAPTTTLGGFVGGVDTFVNRKLWTNPIATMVDMTTSLFTGKRSMTMAGGFASGAKKGVKTGVSKEYWKTGFEPMDGISGKTKYDAPRDINYGNSKAGSVAGKYVNGVYRTMGLVDKPWKYGAQKEALKSMAKAEGLNKGYKGKQLKQYVDEFIENPPEAALNKSNSEGRYAVFQDETALGDAVGAVSNYFRKKNWNGAAAIVDFVVPFKQIPGSIATRIIKRTPIGAAQNIVKQITEVKKGGQFDQRAFSQAMAEGSSSVPIIAAGYALAQAGQVTGGYPIDEKERKLWQAEGKQPNSVRVGDRWYSLNYIQPFGALLNMGAGAAQADKDGKDGMDIVWAGMAEGGKSVSDMSFLQGVSGAIDAVKNPAMAGERFIQNTASSVVPNFVRSFANASDDYERQASGIKEGIQSAIPGWRQQLPAKKDAYGNDVETKDNFLNRFVNPLKPSIAKNDDVTAELRRLKDNDLGTMPSSSGANALGGDTKLDKKQLTSLNAEVAKSVTEQWKQTMKSDAYLSSSDEDKKKMLNKVKDTYSKSAKYSWAQANGFNDYADKSLPKGLDKRAMEIISTYNEAKANDPSDNQYVKDTLKNWNNGEEVPVTNEIAKAWADYEKKRLEGKISNLEMNKEKKAVLRKAYSSVLNEDEKGYYNVPDKDIISGLEQGLVTQESLKKAMDIDALLVSKGLIASSGFGKTVWNALGLNAPKSPTAKTTGTSKARTSKAKSTKVKTSRAKTGKAKTGGKVAKGGKYNYNLFMFGDAPTKSKSLRDLVNKASAKA